jgi:ATP-binding cassette subfamily B multidrug efflux pump
MLKLARYLQPYSLWLIALIVLTLGQVWANLSLPDYMAKIINQGIVGQDNHLILATGAIMLLVSLAGGVCTVGTGFLASRIGTGFARSLREHVFKKVEGFSLAEFGAFSTASLITRSTNDVQQIQLVLVILLRMVLAAPITGVGAIFKAYRLAPSMTWIMALAVVALIVVIAVVFAFALPKFQKLQKLVDRLNLVTREILTGLRVIRAFNAEGYEEQKFGRANRDLTDVNLFVNRLTSVLQPAMFLIMNLTSIGIIWIGAHRIEAGSLQIGDLLAFLQYSIQVIVSFLMISFVFILVPRASVSAARVAEVLATPATVTEVATPITVPAGGGRVEFTDVSFAYPGAEKPVLHAISFTALPGQTTAIIGSTGSGKSTLINLIPRFYDVTRGGVSIDGVDVRQLRLEELYAKVGYVPQKGVLFSGSVESNIRYGAPDASPREIRHAAKIAQASEFIEKLDDRFAAPIAQGGTNVSGGQKQRLSIARALIRCPEIYLFDDSFSALDFKTDALLRQALEAETKGRTVIIVAQRISTIMQANKIVVLDSGSIVGQGTHRELLRDNAVYREIAQSQLSEKELA